MFGFAFRFEYIFRGFVGLEPWMYPNDLVLYTHDQVNSDVRDEYVPLAM